MTMAPAVDYPKSFHADTLNSNPIKRAWKEDRIDIPSILLGRGQENASTARHDLEEGLKPQRRSPPRARSRGRQNSLKHVKNSNEVLRQRSLKRINKDAVDANAGTREGRSFAVANVGNNGKIYLRPTPQAPRGHQPPSPAYPFNTPSYKESLESDRESSWEMKRWSDTQASRTPTRRPRGHSIDPKPRRSNSFSNHSAGLSRSNSISTIDAHHDIDQGAYRVIINNSCTPQAQQQQIGADGLPTLEVPIPHYRLGTPRFSTRGTAFLHSTVYSTASTGDERDPSIISGNDLNDLFPVPPASNGPTAMSSIPTHELPKPSPNRGVPMRMPITTIAPVFHKAREPIVPGIYDAISANPDDPSIVRYAMTTREISAASPARIITQITSKNFLDYELLSDFFLTVRAYLSTNDLLEYLLARFEWAINRFDDDGRVIRVRAFAAIRHWVLNYFPYDFVVDRDLRVKFCEHLNGLTRHVRTRGHEASDLKLIIDLKKCWNGRCALYWDTLQDDVECRTDHDISPGGIVGSRDSQLTHPNELWAKLATSSSHQLDQEKSVAALHNWVDSVIEAEADGRSKSERQASIAPPSHSSSLLSDQSVQPMSCSVPGKTMKVFTNQTGRNPGPHPVPAVVPAAARRIGAPTAPTQSQGRIARTKVDHQRSGSFSDALRDKRTSLGAIQEGKSTEQVVMSIPFSGSLIRGSVFPPGSPFIDNLTSHGSGSSFKKQESSVEPSTDKLAAQPVSPGVRNLISNIRKAWGSKQPQTSSTPAIMPPAPFMIETKHSNLPMHIAFKIEGFGDQHHQLEALKKNARIDLLCADITEMFERSMTQEDGNVSARSSNTSLPSRIERQPSRESPHLLAPSEREILRRNHSEVTTGSRSIVIMDDTSSPQPPVPIIPNSFSQPTEQDSSYKATNIPFATKSQPSQAEIRPPVPPKSPDRPIYIDGDTTQSELLPEFTIPRPATSHDYKEAASPKEPKPQVPLHKQGPSITTIKSHRSNRSGSISLRKYVSYQSGMRRSGPDRDLGGTGSVQDLASSASITAPTRMLRRRPGGDLRANQNVHDMESIPRPRSTGSISTYAESLRGSAQFLQRTAQNAAHAGSSNDDEQDVREKTPVPRRSLSLVESGPSHKKDLRRSFELAVAEFARIPDEEGGDLEATLLKLEGRFKKSPIGSPNNVAPVHNGKAPSKTPPPVETKSQTCQSQVRQHEADSKESILTPSSSGKQSKDVPAITNEHNPTTQSIYTASEESYSSVPLVERGAGASKERQQGSQAVSDQSNATVPQSFLSPNDPHRRDHHNTSDRASDISSMVRVRRGRYRSSIPTMTTDSFLLDEDEFLSDLSSELSDDDDDDYETDSVLEDAFGTSSRSIKPPSLPPNAGYASGYLPSPPMTNENATTLSSEALRIQDQRKPPTPEPSPVSKLTESAKSRTPNQVDGSVLQPFANRVHQFPTRRHIPFVLAFDPAVLAQQFTLIERDALNEINWQDLIDLKWQQSSPTALNWVEYLRFNDPNGIDLVTARFNIVVKWVLSEIVLTHNVEERAMTVVKFIRTAQYARKHHNYATMLQLTIALTSMDCTRLIQTWAKVPEADRAAMKEMESLVSPLRNFHNLRAEMDGACLDNGCIPVVALFLHDLTYNAQKPSVIASTRYAEPLINFERYRTAATIVKSLLRLIDASAKYDIKIVEGALERCLWMASLSDEGIRGKSREVEP